MEGSAESLPRLGRVTWVLALAAVLAEVGAAEVQYRPRPAAESRLAPRSLMLDAARTGSRLVAVGERGHILVTEDGRTWRQVGCPVQTTLTAVAFPGGHLGWAAGHDAVILRTRDGGESWSLVHAEPALGAPLLDLVFLDEGRGLAVGAYGLLLETLDGGDSWRPREIDDQDLHLNAIALNPPATLLIAGEAGTLFHSADAGGRWRRIRSPYEGSFHGALGLGEGRWLVFGLRGHAYRSTDDARTWERIPTGTEAELLGGTVLPDGVVVLVGLGGAVLTSRDGGSSFSLEIEKQWPGFSAAAEAPGGGILLLGEGGARIRSR